MCGHTFISSPHAKHLTLFWKFHEYNSFFILLCSIMYLCWLYTSFIQTCNHYIHQKDKILSRNIQIFMKIKINILYIQIVKTLSKLELRLWLNFASWLTLNIIWTLSKIIWFFRFYSWLLKKMFYQNLSKFMVSNTNFNMVVIGT